MANIVLNGKSVITQSSTDTPVLGPDILYPNGMVLNVVHNKIDTPHRLKKTDNTFLTINNGHDDTIGSLQLGASITLKHSTNKVLVTGYVSASNINQSEHTAIRIIRTISGQTVSSATASSSTNIIGVGANNDLRGRGTTAHSTAAGLTNRSMIFPINTLDSPMTIGPITYTVQYFSGSEKFLLNTTEDSFNTNNASQINGQSCITLMEISSGVLDPNPVAKRTWQTKTNSESGYTAVSGDRLFVDTSSGTVTVTLPASPAVGAFVRFVDVAGTFATNNLTIGRNSEKIMRSATDMTVSDSFSAFELVYSGSTHGWMITEI